MNNVHKFHVRRRLKLSRCNEENKTRKSLRLELGGGAGISLETEFICCWDHVASFYVDPTTSLHVSDGSAG